MTLEAFDAVYPWIVGVAAVLVAALTFYSRWAVLSGRGIDLYRHPVGKAVLVLVAVAVGAANVTRVVLAWGEPGNVVNGVLAVVTIAVVIVVIVLIARVRRTAPSE